MTTAAPPELPDPDSPRATHARRASSFGAGAGQYRAVRPSYPDAAVDWMLPAGARHVLDLAAGTGKLTERLVARGLHVTAVEPSGGMRVDWVEELTAILHRGDSLEPVHGTPQVDGADGSFTPLEHKTVPWADHLPAASLRALAATRSHLLTLPPAERDELLDAVDQLVATHPALAGRTEIDLPYRAECWRADRVGGAVSAVDA